MTPVPAALVASLVRTQHPSFIAPLRLVASGWDNTVYRLGSSWSVRLPHREVAVPLLVNEQRWLPHLAPLLPVPVPVPAAVGGPAGEYPWPWSINPWLPGRPASAVPVAARIAFAADLARCFAALHVPAPPDAPANAFRGVPLSGRAVAVRERLAGDGFPAPLRQVWEHALEAPPWTGPPVWLHADPHPANLLVGAGGGLAGLIDFGDLTSGDPATDLAAAWMVFDAPGRAAFRAALSELAPLDEATWQRARGWALSIGSAVAEGSADNPEMAAIAAHALAQVLLPE
ncbi:aminoglycoside phosphotransferase family protein [Dactylosporangium siamense]|uniref:Phosphotransferase n=1 Tax=Dactylosporangium siamense TaxID=685454 RepID=A0A919U8E5_9ACTN|nr:aminoglycoside phosphotransferase family protein [Dactylosporangium siamense]GIG42056.1 phosphotransferase [Dactylosporangium siamense]